MEKKHLFSLRSLPIGKILLLFLLIYIALLAIPYIQHKNVLSEKVRKTVILQ